MAEDVFHEIVDEVKAQREEKDRKDGEGIEGCGKAVKDAPEPPKDVPEPQKGEAKSPKEDIRNFECNVCHEKFLTLRGKNIHYARSHVDQGQRIKKPVLKIIEKPSGDNADGNNAEQAVPPVPPRDLCLDILVAIGFDKARLSEMKVKDFHVIYDETISGKLTHVEINFYDGKRNADADQG